MSKHIKPTVLKRVVQRPRFHGDATYTTAALFFHCPGCHKLHAIEEDGKIAFSGHYDKPTFDPVLKFDGLDTCHMLVTNGRIKFLDDCSHSLAGCAVDMMPLEIDDARV